MTQQTLSQFRTSSSGDANSNSYLSSVLPTSIFTDISAGDLSISSGYRAIVGGRGVAVSTTTDYTGITRNSTPGIGSVEYAGQTGYWMGFTNTTYSTTTNWSDGIVATGSTNVTIPTFAIKQSGSNSSNLVGFGSKCVFCRRWNL